MSTTSYSLRSPNRRIEGRYETEGGILVRYRAYRELNGLTYVTLNVAGWAFHGETHIGDVPELLAPVCGRQGRKVVAQIVHELTAQEAR